MAHARVTIESIQPTRNVVQVVLLGRDGRRELRTELEPGGTITVPLYTEDFAPDGETIRIELVERPRIFLGC